MRNKKNIWLIAVFLLVGISAFIFTAGGNKDGFDATLYFFGSDGYTIVPVETEIYAQNPDEIYKKVAEELIRGPQDKKYLPIMDKQVELISAVNAEGSLTVNFSEEYSEEEILTTYAVIKTYARLPGVREVRVTAGGKPVLGSDNTELGFVSGDAINTESDSDTSTGIRLYFANSDKDALVMEYRTVNITDTQPVELYIVNELIKGPKLKGNIRLLSADTGVLSAETTDGICYVNFKQDFIDKNIASQDLVRLTVYSVVNSLTEQDSVKSVQFLVDGKKTEKLGDLNISELFKRNEMLIE